MLVRTRNVNGGDGQRWVTNSSLVRTVRNVDITCVGTDHIAVAWIERLKQTTRARLVIQSQSDFTTAQFRKAFVLGKAVLSGGISVAGTSDGVTVAWTKGEDRDVKLQHFTVGPGAEPEITKGPVIALADKDAQWPQLAARADRVVAAYTDRGKVKVRVSDDDAATFGPPIRIVGTGKKATPSRANSIDVSDERVVVTGPWSTPAAT